MRAMYLVLEEGLDDLQSSTAAHAVAMSLKKLDVLAQDFGVTPLRMFCQRVVGTAGDVTRKDAYSTPTSDGWFEANDALDTVGALGDYVEADPGCFARAEQIAAELQMLESVLDRAAGEGVRIRFEIE